MTWGTWIAWMTALCAAPLAHAWGAAAPDPPGSSTGWNVSTVIAAVGAMGGIAGLVSVIFTIGSKRQNFFDERMIRSVRNAEVRGTVEDFMIRLLNTSDFLSGEIIKLITSDQVMEKISNHHLITGMVDAKTQTARKDLESRLISLPSGRYGAEAESPDAGKLEALFRALASTGSRSSEQPGARSGRGWWRR
jgi:hypothetical protein